MLILLTWNLWYKFPGTLTTVLNSLLVHTYIMSDVNFPRLDVVKKLSLRISASYRTSGLIIRTSRRFEILLFCLKQFFLYFILLVYFHSVHGYLLPEKERERKFECTESGHIGIFKYMIQQLIIISTIPGIFIQGQSF